MGLPDSERTRARNRSAGLQFLLYPVIAIAALWYGADALLNYKATLNTIAPTENAEASAKPAALDSKSKPLILKTDPQGHFRGTALINNVAMPFLIDTGATKTSIPAKMAVSAGLPVGGSIRANTAGGQVIDHLTRINSLKIGNAEIRNLDADINQYLDEVLIGMNTLKYFHMTQSGDKLTLVAIKQSGKTKDSVQVLDKPSKKPFTLKKTVTCDEREVCITAYSDH